MIAKEVHLKGSDGYNNFREGIRVLAEAVGSTAGPLGRSVVIESNNHVGGKTITKDGITVAKAINLLDASMDLAVSIVRESSERTALSAGDGSTATIIMAAALIEAFEKHDIKNRTKSLRDIKRILDSVVENIKTLSKEITPERLKQVATISTNNNEELGNLISDVYAETNHVTVEKSSSSDTYAEVIHGIQYKRGYSSKFYVNNHKNNTCELDNPLILISDHELNNLDYIKDIIAYCINNNRPLFYIGEISLQAAATMNANVQRGVIKFANIIPDEYGYKKEEILSDLAVATGGRYISEKMGDNLMSVGIHDLGTARKVIVGYDSTSIILSDDQLVGEALKSHIVALETQRTLTKDRDTLEFIDKRLRLLSGSIGIVYAGGNSTVEVDSTYDLLEDAVLAVRSSLSDGVVPGAGLSYLMALEKLVVEGTDEEVIVGEMLLAPFKKICENADIDAFEVVDKALKAGGFNIIDEVFGDAFELGIINPAKVDIEVIKNSFSVASQILSTDVIIVNKRA